MKIKVSYIVDDSEMTDEQYKNQIDSVVYLDSAMLCDIIEGKMDYKITNIPKTATVGEITKVEIV